MAAQTNLQRIFCVFGYFFIQPNTFVSSNQKNACTTCYLVRGTDSIRFDSIRVMYCRLSFSQIDNAYSKNCSGLIDLLNSVSAVGRKKLVIIVNGHVSIGKQHPIGPLAHI